MTEFDTAKNKCLIDSNIWLYAFIETQDSGKSSIAKSVIQNKDISILLSTQIINEVCINLIKKAGFSEEKIRRLINSFYRKYDVIGIEREILFKSSEIREKHNFSFWDSLVFASALYSGADILYSEDMQSGFVIEKTQIINPFKR